MSWYAAHLVMVVKLKKGRQVRFPVWENIVLFRAASEDEAFAKAEERGRKDAAEDSSFRWGGQPARWVFAGVRKLTLCEDSQRRPSDGTEVSFLEMELTSEDAVHLLLSGKPVSVQIDEQFRDEPATAGAKN